jgi:hypothetical protein
MKRLIITLCLITLLMAAIPTPAHADGVAGTLEITCDQWTRTYYVQIGTWSADSGWWNTHALSYGCFLTGHALSPGYVMYMENREIGWKSGIYETVIRIAR